MAYWKKLDTIEQILIEKNKLYPFETLEQWVMHMMNTKGVSMSGLHRELSGMVKKFLPDMIFPTQSTLYNYLGQKGYTLQTVIIPFGQEVQILDKIDAY